MSPIIKRIGPLTVRWYGVMYAIALLMGSVIVYKEALRKKLPLSFVDIIDFILISFVPGLIGARLYFAFFHFPTLVNDPLNLVGLGRGTEFGLSGLAIHGGLIGGLCGAFLFTWWKKVNFWKFADCLAPALILGQGLGRWGNFMNGGAFGIPTKLPWGIVFPLRSPAGSAFPHTPLHPTMVYEMIINLGIFIYLWRVRKRNYRDGFIISLYFILYSAGRSLVSIVRADSLWLGPIRAAHVSSILLFFGFGYFVLKNKLYRRTSITGNSS